MPNQLTANGLELATREELIANFTARLQTIYGADINVSSDSADGQWINEIVQAAIDVENLMMQVYTSFDPDQAFGKTLDMRVAINGIQRQAGTPTITNILVTVDRAVNLYGVDQEAFQTFVVADNEGNEYVLQETTSLLAGAHTLTFQAVVPGARPTTPNTITTPVTIVLGVVSVNNPTSYITLGINEESDAELKIRRQKSTAIGSQGYLAGLIGALENIPGVTNVMVYENTTGSTDGDGIPGHSIWVIVAGSGDASDIAKAIYNKRNAGCGLKGDQTFNVVQPGGNIFAVRWDNVEEENLFIKFTATSLDGVNPVNVANIREQLPNYFKPGVYEQVNINDLATAIQLIDNNCLVTNAGFSTTAGGSYTNTLTPSAKNKQFAVQSANVIILPILISPTSSTVEAAEEVQFSSLGGYGTITYTVHTNNSGATINGATGLYTAGAVTGVTDTIRATDSLGNFAAATVNVTV